MYWLLTTQSQDPGIGKGDYLFEKIHTVEEIRSAALEDTAGRCAGMTWLQNYPEGWKNTVRIAIHGTINSNKNASFTFKKNIITKIPTT